ncbi:hypothetical protein [Aeromonas allosaccharophila]|uniref:hypothetical protein n=1 Tax=Aeromonas allosaccharophila TaxID=656 RepID=UPI002AE01F37|nr:hypothetical protein [Aeromonas allosaccharophila]
MNSSDLADIAAFWGALTGSFALLFQASAHFKNKAKLKLSPKMSIGSTLSRSFTEAAEMIDFEVGVVNVGHRVAIVDKVSISVKYSWWRRVFLKRHSAEIILLSAKSEEEYKVLTEGQKFTFQLRRWDEQLQSLSDTMNEREYVIVRLTTGQVVKGKFKTINFSKFNELRQQYAPDA